ncbi:MAG: copper amine oxidase N-terminal domain-containing protein, partial [Desulfocucumaceae bacterium]
MRNFIMAIAILLTFAGACIAGEAPAPPPAPAVFVNGQPLNVQNPSITENNIIMVPIRPVLDALHKNASWNDQEQSVASGPIWLQVNNPMAKVGNLQIKLDTPPRLVGDQVYVPLRFLSEVFGLTVRGDVISPAIEISQSPAVLKEYDAIWKGMSLTKSETILSTCNKFVESYSMNDEAYQLWSALDGDAKQKFVRNRAYNLKVVAGKMLIYEMTIYDSSNSNIIYHGRWEDRIALMAIGFYCADLERATSLMEKNARVIAAQAHWVANLELGRRSFEIALYIQRNNYRDFKDRDKEIEEIIRGKLFAPPPDCIEVYGILMSTYQTYMQLKEFGLNQTIPQVMLYDVEP